MKQISQNTNSEQRAELTRLQKEAVSYFFMRLKTIYLSQYQHLMPDEHTEKLAKREYARQVCNISKQKMDDGFNALHEQRQSDPKSWEFLNIDKVIGLVKSGGHHWQHRVIKAKDAEWAEKQNLLNSKRSQESLEKNAEIIARLRSAISKSGI